LDALGEGDLWRVGHFGVGRGAIIINIGVACACYLSYSWLYIERIIPASA
jgi:hypothetical protein